MDIVIQLEGVIVGGADPPEFLSDHLIKKTSALRMALNRINDLWV